MKGSFNFLKLVYPPISNQCAEWLWEEPVVREFVARSKLYMIAQREEVFFRDYRLNEETSRFEFSLAMGDELAKDLSVNFDDLTLCSDKVVEIEAGSQILRIWEIVNNERTSEPLYWATTDKFLYDIWRGRFEITGELDVRRFTKFQLHYVGISKSNDSFTRLFANGHKNRSRILGNETQFAPTARLTDELYIFLFEVTALQVAVIEDEDNLDFDLIGSKEELAADAEKAFVRILESKYNEEKYLNYPKGKDGLFGKGLDRYGFMIDEDIEFVTASRSLRGVHRYFELQLDHPDFIFIEGESVSVVDHQTSANYVQPTT